MTAIRQKVILTEKEINDYANGKLSMQNIAKAHGCTKDTVSKRLKETKRADVIEQIQHNSKRGAAKLSEKQIQEIITRDYAGYLPDDDAHPIYPDVYPGRDRYNKNTCIWCGGGFIEPERRRIEPEHKDNPGWKKCGGKSLKTKNIRSATPRGFAKAVFLENKE